MLALIYSTKKKMLSVNKLISLLLSGSSQIFLLRRRLKVYDGFSVILSFLQLRSGHFNRLLDGGDEFNLRHWSASVPKLIDNVSLLIRNIFHIHALYKMFFLSFVYIRNERFPKHFLKLSVLYSFVRGNDSSVRVSYIK